MHSFAWEAASLVYMQQTAHHPLKHTTCSGRSHAVPTAEKNIFFLWTHPTGEQKHMKVISQGLPPLLH